MEPMVIKLMVIFTITAQCKCYENVNCGRKYSENVNYYENLISREVNESLNYQLPNSAAEHRPKTNEVNDYGLVDFIIVGAGPTGSVIANRLSEVKKWKVLVLEAGESPSEFSEIPGVYQYLSHTKFNWNYKSIKQSKYCLGYVDQRCPVTRGKIIGGTSEINGLVYGRGAKEDFRRWTSQGIKGWSFDDVLPYYVKSENSQVDGDPNYHGKGGYWNVKSLQTSSLQYSALIEAHEQLFNCTLNNDYNGKNQLGISNLQFNLIRNKRHSAGTAFLKTAEKRENLKVLERAFVTKILISNRLKQAYGVEFTHNGKLYHAGAKKEVILSAGAISSPKILMLSGIGPKEELGKHNIPITKDLPVGESLYEPSGYDVLFIHTNISIPKKTLEERVDDYLSFSGAYENPGNANGIGLFQSSFVKTDGYPDIELKYIGIPSGLPSRKVSPYSDSIYNAVNDKLEPQSTFTVYLTVLQPKSVGTIKLASSDPYDYPLIDLNILGDPQDVEVMYQSLQIVKRLLATPAMKAINASIVSPDFPRCRKFGVGSEGYWKCAFELLAASTYASSSTCRMGPNQSSAVVNDKLEVFGVRSLRVADISVFPDPVSASPTATAVMIGEKISDVIKVDNGEKIYSINNYFK